MNTLIIGVDPGPTTGIVALQSRGAPAVVQADAATAPLLVNALMGGANGPVLLAVEQFVIGRASMRAGRHGGVTRELIGQLVAYCRTGHPHRAVVLRSASQVKPWATDGRLAAAGLIEPTKGMNHARDAARHALFAAVHAGLISDPFSRAVGER